MLMRILLGCTIAVWVAACEPTSDQRAAQSSHLETYGSRAGFR